MIDVQGVINVNQTAGNTFVYGPGNNAEYGLALTMIGSIAQMNLGYTSSNAGDLRLKDNTIHFSAIGDLGVQYRLLPNVGLFLQPEVSYYFKPTNPVLETYRTEHPLTFSLGVGARFSF